MSDAAVSLNSITKVYKRSHLGKTTLIPGVKDITFTVAPGEVFGLLGLNGSGKTTTLKLLLGLLFPTSGEARLFGKPAGSRAAKETLGYLPEIPYFYRHLTGHEVLSFYGSLSGLSSDSLRRRVDAVLEEVRMTAAARRPMREYSKGMLQRIGLAQAMLHNPRLLVFDEPVTGLDPLGLREMRVIIQNLNDAGKTVLFSSHSISEVEKLCHRVGVLVKGQLVRVVNRAEWTGGDPLEDIFVRTVDPEGRRS
ncbi:MAG: ABC transporter ATP-binding protein [Elusimicrobia bacterium]|jgi:ABC-2 type transport system ATP-binding protein|nr:ABC transporter ATP-binding protein [Elusimicrobiota bacterium]MBK7208472.1 ABC transporter ATP-binding protein [Elusimicrobiota bacterium]MBK7545232.1 ABC transporter ATP-binding protein [Elusimicrobiota bacterium]MBK7688673.1 ABC transporter ATP-binding protein [Elusimicrobiota bacterium]MBK8126898.1 ABC transporter ATP-binding protein [Elusimicrobiota bacterium]